jgi:DNA-binding NtrC family response regulator
MIRLGPTLEYIRCVTHLHAGRTEGFQRGFKTGSGILPMTGEKLPRPVVLVIDDEPLIRWSLSEALTERGYAVRQASTGAEARQELEASVGQPLVVLLDLRLPDVVDLSLLRDIRARRPDAPVVMMTAHGTDEDSRSAKRLGAFRFVTKPFDVGEMIDLVGEAWSAS